MMRIKDTEGTIREVEGMDIEVWDANLLGDGEFKGMIVSGYVSLRGADGYWVTYTELPLFHIETRLDPETYGESVWYGYSDDNVPGEIPDEVLEIVNKFVLP